jgi:uncharacterized protein YqgV (UPF0045/DUF77 family)
MKISVEISMYPLDPEFGTPILKFINRLRQYEHLQVSSNTMSSQIFGEFDEVMDVLNREMKTSFEGEQTVVMVVKIANLDLRP